VTLTAGSPNPAAGPIPMAAMAPLSLAESIIEREPGILILDMRADPQAEKGIPGAVGGGDPAEILSLLSGTPSGTVVVAYDESGWFVQAPEDWPRRLEYHFLEGGLAGWNEGVLTPAELRGNALTELERVQRQNQIAAFFSGAAVQNSAVAAPPPAMPSGGAGKKPKAGGC